MGKLTDNQWEVMMHWLLTLVGGFMGVYAVLLHAGNFGSAQTGNVMEMAAELVSILNIPICRNRVVDVEQCNCVF